MAAASGRRRSPNLRLEMAGRRVFERASHLVLERRHRRLEEDEHLGGGIEGERLKRSGELAELGDGGGSASSVAMLTCAAATPRRSTFPTRASTRWCARVPLLDSGRPQGRAQEVKALRAPARSAWSSPRGPGAPP